MKSEKQQAEEKEKQIGAIAMIAPDGTLLSASSYKELAEKVAAYREGR
jgi:hypothetical protein